MVSKLFFFLYSTATTCSEIEFYFFSYIWIYIFFNLENACELEKQLKVYPALETILKWNFDIFLSLSINEIWKTNIRWTWKVLIVSLK